MLTGSPELDQLTGGIQRGLFYFLYGEDTNIDTLFQHLVTQTLRDNEKGRPVAIYMLAGNYRRERTNLSIKELARAQNWELRADWLEVLVPICSRMYA